MTALIIHRWQGHIHTAIDHADKPNPLRCVLGTEKRVPLKGDLAKWPMGLVILVLLQRGEIG